MTGLVNIFQGMARRHFQSKVEDRKEKETEQVLSILEKAGLRKTKPRTAVLSFLIDEHGPFSIDEIFQALKRQELDLVTVYRCLAAFEKIGVVRRCDFGDGVSRYEFQHDPKHHHHHVICTSCRKTESLESCKLPDIESQAKKLGFSNLSHSLEFFGLCKHCKQKSA